MKCVYHLTKISTEISRKKQHMSVKSLYFLRKNYRRKNLCKPVNIHVISVKSEGKKVHEMSVKCIPKELHIILM